MQQRLSLAFTAPDIARLAVQLNLTHVASYSLPAFYLSRIFVRESSA
jgi:hypothetical protein